MARKSTGDIGFYNVERLEVLQERQGPQRSKKAEEDEVHIMKGPSPEPTRVQTGRPYRPDMSSIKGPRQEARGTWA